MIFSMHNQVRFALTCSLFVLSLSLLAENQTKTKPKTESWSNPKCGTLQPYVAELSNSHQFTLRAAVLEIHALAGCKPVRITGDGQTIIYSYDKKTGMPVREIKDGQVTKYKYNSYGFLSKIEGACPENKSATYITKITYDSLGRRDKHDRQTPKDCWQKGREAYSHTCQADYKSKAEFENNSDGTIFLTNFEYNKNNKLIRVSNSGGGGAGSAETFEYDKNGRVVSSTLTDPWRTGIPGIGKCKKLTFKYTYDKDGRLLSRDSGPGNTPGDLFIKYDSKGRAVEVKTTDYYINNGYDGGCENISDQKTYSLHY